MTNPRTHSPEPEVPDSSEADGLVRDAALYVNSATPEGPALRDLQIAQTKALLAVFQELRALRLELRHTEYARHRDFHELEDDLQALTRQVDRLS